MILSALATSVGINLALTVLLAGVYTLLRCRPGYVEVYSPRRPYAPLEPWLCAAWRRSEEEIHAAAGLDGVVFVRIFVFRWEHAPETSPPLLRLLSVFFSNWVRFLAQWSVLLGRLQHQNLRGSRGAGGRRSHAGELPGGPAPGDRLLRPAQQVHRPLQHLQRPGRVQKVRNSSPLVLDLMQI
jgi:hypothetical protein